MGRATRWLRSLWGGKKESRERKDTATMAVDDRRVKKRWSFKSTRDSCEAEAPVPAALPAENTAWLRTLYAETEKEQSRHAIAVAAATAAAADAAVAAAQAAVAVVRLTSHGQSTKLGSAHEWLAAVRIQRVFRGYLAKKALRALKALVKLQALVRGYLVRKQAAATFHSMQALFRAQATVRAQKSRAFLTEEVNFHPEDIHRISLERYDESRSEHTSSFHRRQLSASLDSPKIVQIDSCRPKSSSRRGAHSAMETSEECFPNSMSSPLPTICPGRVSIPDCHRSFNEHEWGFPADKCRYSSTAQSTPRCVSSGASFTPSTPKNVCCDGDGKFRRYLGVVNSPNYMNNTRSFEAKVRSQSAPKQRPDPAGLRKRLPLSELVIEQSRASLSGVGMQKPQEAFSFKRAVVGRLDRSLQVSSEAERDFFLQKKW